MSDHDFILFALLFLNCGSVFNPILASVHLYYSDLLRWERTRDGTGFVRLICKSRQHEKFSVISGKLKKQGSKQLSA